MYSTQYIRVSLILQHRSLEFLRVTRKNCNYAKNFAIKSSTRTRRPRKIFKDTHVINAYLFIYIRFLSLFCFFQVSLLKKIPTAKETKILTEVDDFRRRFQAIWKFARKPFEPSFGGNISNFKMRNNAARKIFFFFFLSTNTSLKRISK